MTTQEREDRIVEWIRSFGSLNNFRKAQEKYYRGILVNFKYLLDLAFPDRTKVDRTKVDPEGRKKLILKFIEDNKRKPKKHCKDKEERRLGGSMRDYCNINRSTYDESFLHIIKNLLNNDSKIDVNKKLIIDFINKHKRKPSRYSKDREEKTLGGRMASYCFPTSRSYDPNFKAQVNELLLKYKIEQTKEEEK